MSEPLPSKRDLAVRPGPTRGNAPTVVVALQTGRHCPSEAVLAELKIRLEDLQTTELVEQQAPRRGKKLSRERVVMTVRFVHGIRPKMAEKAVRSVVFNLLDRITRIRPARRIERRRERHQQRQALRVQQIERWLAPAR